MADLPIRTGIALDDLIPWSNEGDNLTGDRYLTTVSEVVALAAGTGVTAAIRTATATADGLTTGTLTAGSQFTTVTSASADHIIVLPAPVIGTVVRLKNGATGYEIRSNAPTTVLINNGTGGAAVESAVAANITVTLTCVSATNWIGSQSTLAGVVSALEVAA